MATLDQSHTTTNNAHAMRYNASYWHPEQQFTPSVTASVSQVDIPIYKISSPTGNVWVQIWSDSGADTPNAQIGGNSSLVSIASLGTSYPAPFTVFTFASPISVTAGTKYWIVVCGDNTIDGVNYMGVNVDESGGYSGGIYCRTYSGGHACTSLWDWDFKEYYDTSIAVGQSGFMIPGVQIVTY